MGKTAFRQSDVTRAVKGAQAAGMDIAAFMRAARVHVALPFAIAIKTGPRQSDVLHMTWAQYDGASIRLRQSKTGKRLTVPLTHSLRIRLDAMARPAEVICLSSRGTPWTSDGFKSSFAEAKAAAVKAGAVRIGGLTFHDTRGTAVVNLALAGCSVPEIVSITGHSLKDAEAILDAHYLERDRRLGEAAISKLEQRVSRARSCKRICKRPCFRTDRQRVSYWILMVARGGLEPPTP
ncbi:tyrosine-type recombinase/integrase [Paenirhodobacter enshiensis]|uniref:tyrosine-type recombinase/integrase n=1 Tax=Paenirhodobacter enshiensis TaxID=1105367 RepID=UPI001FE0568D|nr:tyrosine-type recombinase/integrase [Paenirhodobacter enshiensis]